MTEEEFKRRTRAVGLRVIKLVEALPGSRTADVIGRQLLRSALSIGANYRAACRGVSRADVISKLGDVEEETDESLYWIEMLIDAGIVKEKKLSSLRGEIEEILAMTVASIRTLRRKGAARIQKSKIQNLKSPRAYAVFLSNVRNRIDRRRELLSCVRGADLAA